MEKIYLDANEITDLWAKLIAQSIAFSESLTEIYLSWNKLTETWLQNIADSLILNKSLKKIYLWWYKITKNVQETLEIVKIHNPRLCILGLYIEKKLITEQQKNIFWNQIIERANKLVSEESY